MTRNHDIRHESDLAFDLEFTDQQVAEAQLRIASAKAILNNRTTSIPAHQVMDFASAILDAAIAQLERIEKVRHS